jgi:Trypsin-co-occurring domain 1
MADIEGRPVQVELPSGQLVWVKVDAAELAQQPEADDSEPGLAQDTGGHRRTRRDQSDQSDQPPAEMDGGIHRLTGFSEAIGGIAESVWTSLKTTMHPDTVEIEFGLDIDAATGQVVSLIANVHASSSIKVKLGWENKRAEEHPGPSKSQGDEAEPTA